MGLDQGATMDGRVAREAPCPTLSPGNCRFSGYGVDLRDIPSRRPAHEAEFIQPHHRVVPELEFHPDLAGDTLEQLGFLFEQVKRDLRMEPDRHLSFPALKTNPFERPLEPAGDHLRPKYPARPATGWAIGR